MLFIGWLLQKFHCSYLTKRGVKKLIGKRPEWWFLKGLVRKKLPHRQEDTYELEETALAAKRKQELPLEAISSIGS